MHSFQTCSAYKMKISFHPNACCSLASRIILNDPQSFNVFIARRAHQGTVEEEDVIELGPDELINIIRCHIPDLDFDPDIAQRGEECGMTHLLPNEPRDLVTIDYTLIKLVIDKETGTKRTTVALAYIAILLCQIGSDLRYITGLSIQSFRWRYLNMAMHFEWISRLFDENFWVERVTPRLFVPYNPELALTSSILFDEGEVE